MRAEPTSTGLDVVQERGIALIAALMIMLLMSALMIGFTAVVMSDQRYRGIDNERTRAFYGAQSGVEKLSTDLGNLFLTNVSPTAAQIAALANTPPTISNVTYVAPAGVTAYGVTLIPCQSPPQVAVALFSCNQTIQAGPYQGLIALKKMYKLDAVARTSAGAEAHLMRNVESVAIPVFQFGTFSDVGLTLFAGGTFTFGGRIHTNGNLFLAAQNGGTTTLTDKVTAVGDIIRKRMQNGLTLAAAGFAGTLNAATAPGTFRSLLDTEGSVTDGDGSTPNASWPTVSLSTYNGYLRNGGCPPVGGCSTPPRGTGAKPLNLAVITVGGTNTDLTRRAPVNENVTNPVLFGERMFGKVSVRILLSDTAADITSLPTVTATAPVHLGDEGVLGAGLTNDWAATVPPPSNGVAFLGVGTAIPGGGVMTPIARSPGLQTVRMTADTNAGDTFVKVQGPFVAPYNSPATLIFDIFVNQLTANAGMPIFQTVKCTIVTSTQFQTCLNSTGLGLLAVPAGYVIKVKDGSSLNQTFTTTAAVSAGGVGTNRTYTVASTASAVANTFWMQNSGDQTWSTATCTDISSNAVSGGNVVLWQNCSGVPNPASRSVASGGVGPGITTGALVGQNVGAIGGYLKIEIQKADFTWLDVTMEVLNWGFADKNQAGTICADPTPNAIIRLQRLRDNANNCHYYPASAQTPTANNSYDYWPNTIFDVREALYRDVAPANNDVTLGGVMHYITLDVGNLNKWLKGNAPYAAGNGVNAFSNNGYGIYFSDRRNNRADGTNGTVLNQETGEYGFEDIVNPLDANGLPNALLDAGEDVNGNGLLDAYGQFPNFMAVGNNLPPGAFAIAANIRPATFVGRSGAMTSRAFLFRRALKLTNGGLAAFTTPGVTGLTFVTENPVYVQGDWNSSAAALVTDPHAETSVIADAVTLLSTAWTDSNAFINPYTSGNRLRNVGWYRLAIIGGKGMAFPWPAAGTPNGTFGTDGGAHNFLRYLESGAGTTNYRGAIATFYYSRQAVGIYKFGSGMVYSAPTRAYAFDTDFLDPAKLPPLTPVFRDLNALGFAQEIRPGK